MSTVETGIKKIKINSCKRSFSLSMKVAFKYMVVFAILAIYIYNLLVSSSTMNTQLFAWSILLLSLYLALKVKNNINLFIVYSLIAYFNYSIVITNYIYMYTSNYFTSFRNEPASYLGLNILFLFTLLLVVFIPRNIQPTFTSNYRYIKEKTNNLHLITFLIVIILLYILIFKFNRPDLPGLRGSPTPLYEYSIIFFIVGFHFTGNNKISKMLLSILLALFALQNFIFGGRIIGLQLIMLYFIMFYSYKKKIINIIPYIIIGFILMSLIGIDRATLSLSVDSIRMVIENIKLRKFALDTSYSAYFTSLTFLKVKEMLSEAEQFNLFIQFILSIIFGGKIKNSSLPIYTRSFYLHYNGGIIPYYFYFYLGWVGVILSALILMLYTNYINNNSSNKSGFNSCLTVYFTTTVFRWYLYTPVIILRGTILLGIVYFIFNLASRLKLHVSRS